MSERAALEHVFDLARAPGLARKLRKRPLPGGMLQVLRLAAGDEHSLNEVVSQTGRSAAALRDAAQFYIVQVLLNPRRGQLSHSGRHIGRHPGRVAYAHGLAVEVPSSGCNAWRSPSGVCFSRNGRVGEPQERRTPPAVRRGTRSSECTRTGVQKRKPTLRGGETSTSLACILEPDGPFSRGQE